MNNIMLRDEQKVLIDLLQKYKCLRLSQVKDILNYYYEKFDIDMSLDDYHVYILEFLSNKKLIDIDASKFVKINSDIKPAYYENTIMSFWVYLSFLGQVDLRENFPAPFPSEIFFIKDQQQYEALYIPEGQEYIVNMLLSEQEKELSKELKELTDREIIKKFVIGVDSAKSIEKIQRYPIDKSLFKNILFVVMEFTDPTERPNRKFVAL